MAASIVICSYYNMSVKIIPEFLHRQRVLSRILHTNRIKRSCRCLSSASDTAGSGAPKNNSMLTMTTSLSSIGQNRLGRMMQLYEDVVGLTEVKLAQEKVVNAEQKFLQVQEDRRAMQQELLSVQAEVRAVGAELEKTSRTDTRYIDLVKKEHEALLLEKEMTNKIKALDKAERDFFGLLSAALRESHEKERARAEKTKYWSIIGSVIGAIIGILGSTFNNYKRMKELRAIVTESGENTAQYKALADKMVQAVFAQQSKIEEFVSSVKNLEDDGDVGQIRLIDPLFVNHSDFTQHTETLLAALQNQSEALMKSLSEIQKLLSIDQASNINDHVVYVGPELEKILQKTEDKLQAEFQKNRWVSAVAFTGLITVSVLSLFLRGSS
ncbi:unnamed protein product [Candidula unifasciata]|uniref:Uncharacterized protein n=1 Tax=Candidula unifasciata TaxID=100452 RepID=A0A8S3YNV4_9EUPU|nr:unnamed protein product [Candidula unifasciata]